MYIDQPLRHFMDKLASRSPEPGGGSVAALTGALGAGLVSMVCSLTAGKEKYKDVQPRIEELLRESEKLRQERHVCSNERPRSPSQAPSERHQSRRAPNAAPMELEERLGRAFTTHMSLLRSWSG